MSAIDELIKLVNGSGLTSDKEKANTARAELAALRATVAEQAQQLESLKSALSDQEKYWHDAVISQARQLEEARRLIKEYDRTVYDNRCEDWLSANPAPAPRAEQEQTK